MAAFATYRSANPLLVMALLAGFIIGGLPSFIGVTVVTFDSRPAFSLDICHPLQSADPAAAPALTVPEPPFALHPILADVGEQVQTVIPELEERSDPPDSPPPR
jgi:hypothetical protein